MPIESVHPQYKYASSDWVKIRDVVEGERAVKEKSTQYLPRLGGFDSTEYAAYKQRALFFEATPRTVSGLVGAMFRVDPVVEMKARQSTQDDIMDNITLTGVGFTSFAKFLANEVLSLGRVGVLVDVPPVEGLRPYARAYMAEDICNWRVEVINGVPELRLVVLKEQGLVFADDPYEPEVRERLRELTFGVEVGEGGRETGRAGYVQRLWEKQKNRAMKEEWVLIDTFFPVNAGAPLDFIPFKFIGPTTLEPEVERSPILGMVNVNLSHYITSADLEHGAHFTALPTPWVSGLTEDVSNLRIGASTAWTLPEGATAGMLEYHGTGLEALEKRLERKEHAMAILGARLLEDQKRAAEAADTVRMRHSGENSVLAGISETVSQGTSDILSWMIWWSGGEMESAVVDINKDFVAEPMDATMLTALIKGWQSQAYPKSVLRHNLRQGEIIPPEMTDEELDEELENEQPPGLGMMFDDPRRPEPEDDPDDEEDEDDKD